MHFSKLAAARLSLVFFVTLVILALSLPSIALAGQDETAPELKKVQVSPSQITKPGVIKVFLDISENETGVENVSLELALLDENGDVASSTGTNNVIVVESFSELSLYSGTHEFDVPIPETVKNGEWTVSRIIFEDNAGNKSYYNYYHPHIFTPQGEYYEDPYIADGQDSSVRLSCVYFKVESEFDIAFQYGANNPNLASALNAMNDGEAGEVIVNSRNGYTIPASAFSAIKGNNKYLIINDGGVQWVFYGKNILHEDKSINTETVVSSVSGADFGVTDNVVQVVFADNGELPGKAQIRLKSDYLYNKAGVKGTIYVYCKTKDSLELETASSELVMDGTDKWCYFDLSHNSTFILASEKLAEKTTNTANNTTDKMPQATPAPQPKAGKWMKSAKGWWYQYSDKTFAKGLTTIGSAKYFFDNNGWMKTGWQHATGNGDWYYFDKSGVMKTGWVKASGKWYYTDKSSGIMQKGKLALSDGTYFFNNSGVMRTGWVQDAGKWYYANTSGKMVTGWKKISGKWYYMNAEGVMQTGKLTVKDATYFMNSSGAMRTGWVQVGSKWYYTNKSGVMQTGWKKISGKWYYMNSDGVMQNTKQTIKEKTYNFKSSGAMITGWNKENGKWYYYDKSGVMKANTWISGKYWVDTDGVMATNAWVDGDEYYVDKNGKWVKGAQK